MAKENRDKEKELQQKYLELQLINNQMNQMQQHLNLIEAQILDLKHLENSLEEIKNVKEDTEILVPLGSGTFIKGKLIDNKEVLMNVGANTIVKKDLEDAISIIKNQEEELKNLIEQVERELTEVSVQAQIVQQEVQDLVKE